MIGCLIQIRPYIRTRTSSPRDLLHQPCEYVSSDIRCQVGISRQLEGVPVDIPVEFFVGAGEVGRRHCSPLGRNVTSVCRFLSYTTQTVRSWHSSSWITRELLTA